MHVSGLARIPLLVCSVLALVAGGARAGVSVRVSAEDGTVYADARETGLFEPDLDTSLRSGLPARVRVDIVLYERRAALWDREVLRHSWRVSVLFDVLEERYTVLDDNDGVLLEVGDLAGVEEFVGGLELWPLCALADLDAGREHYVGVEFRIEPLSVEEVRDLERWLRGNVRQGARLSDVPGQLVGILRNQLGLGDRLERGRSAEFTPAALSPPD